jgi:hypothetical protein
MILNDALIRQTVLSKLTLSRDGKELSKTLKVKLMRMRIAYNKIRAQFDSDNSEMIKELVPTELSELSQKTDRTPEEETRFNELNDKANSEYQEYLAQKGKEEVDVPDDKFTEEEYADLLDVNSTDETFDINGYKITSIDLMENLYNLFV